MNGGLTIYKKLFSFMVLLVTAQTLSIFFSSDALATVQPAQGVGACGAGAGLTFGGMICNVVQQTRDSQAIFPAMSYLFGLVMGIWAIAKLVEHVNNPQQVSYWEPIKRAIVAGALFALPIMVEAIYVTLNAGTTGTGISLTGWSGQTTGAGLDAMVVALMNDSYENFSSLLMFFCYLAALTLLIIGILRLLKSAQEGPRGPGGFGTIMTFLVAGALLSADEMMAAFSNTIAGSDQVTTQNTLQFNAGLKANEEQHVQSVISAVIAFVMILGWISFVRGWFIIRDVAEGNQQASLMAGMTHLFGGALAINLGPVLNAVQTTFGLNAIGVNFS